MPDIEETLKLTSADVKQTLALRVRVERRKLGLSQAALAELCDVPLRTYKRFELNQCDSLDVLIRIAAYFGRIQAFELIFPPKVSSIESKHPLDVLARLRAKIEQKSES